MLHSKIVRKGVRTLEDERKPIIKVDNLKVYYPVTNMAFQKNQQQVHAVDEVSFDIMEGETLGIVGESGCGKSTIGRTLVALEQPTEGRVFYRGHEISSMSQKELQSIRTDFQMIFQDTTASLNPRKTIYEIIAAPMLYHKLVSKENVHQEVKRLFELVGLSPKTMNRFPHEFSGGQRQRIGIARALSLKPKLIVCDEPVSALDVSVQAQILNLLKDIQQELNLTYVFIAHGLAAVRYVSTRIAVVYLGKIVEIADANELFENPLHPYTKSLVDASPLPDPKLRERTRIIIEGEIPSSIHPPSGCRYHERCPYAVEECSRIQPELKPISPDSNHLCACPYFKEISENSLVQ